MAATHDEKEFLALLQPYSSDETRKARRNLSMIGFIVICAWLLGLQLNDVRIFGADISKSNEVVVLGICFALLVYWTAMFLVCWMHDREIEKERKIQGQQAADAIVSRFEKQEEQKSKTAKGMFISPDYAELKRAVAAYNCQKQRTTRANRFGIAISAAELHVPLALAASASIILLVGAVHAL